MKRFFMIISEAVHLALQAGGMGGRGELYVLKMGGDSSALRGGHRRRSHAGVEAILCDWIPTFAPSFTGLPPQVEANAGRHAVGR